MQFPRQMLPVTRPRTTPVHRRPIVFLRPPREKQESVDHGAKDRALAALQVPPLDRTQEHVKAIMNYVGKWKSFRNVVKAEPIQKEICRCMHLEEYKANTVLFQEGDSPESGWYLIFEGQCSIFKSEPNDSFQKDIDPLTLRVLKSNARNTKYFHHLVTIRDCTEFGSIALTTDRPRNATILVDKDSLLLRVESQLYQATIKSYAKSQLLLKAELLMHLKNFQGFSSDKNTVLRLAENMDTGKLEVGQTISGIVNGLIVIEEGLVVQKRKVSFDPNWDYKLDEELPIPSIPDGQRTVKVQEFGSNTIIPDPSIVETSETMKNVYTLQVKESVTYHTLILDNLKISLRFDTFSEVQEFIRDQPSDFDVANNYLVKQQAIMWNKFKKKCVRDVRTAAKVERAVLNGTYGMRVASVPKALKEHKGYLPLDRLR